MRTFDDFVKERTYLKNVSPRTIEFYHDCQKSVLRYGDFTEEGLKRWIIGSREAGVSASSINTRITGINAYLRWAGMAYKVTPLNQPQRVLPALGEHEIAKLVSYRGKTRSEKRLHAIVMTLLDTGARIEEILSLGRSGVDLDNLLLRIIGKGNKERIIPISLQLRKVLHRHLASHHFGLVFCTRDGEKLMRRNVLRDFRQHCMKLGFAPPPRALHCLRRTFATNYIRRGGSVFHLQRALGHSTLEMSRRYAELLTEDLQEMQQRVSILNRVRC